MLGERRRRRPDNCGACGAWNGCAAARSTQALGDLEVPFVMETENCHEKEDHFKQ
jgi:hypothetical protein